MTSIKGKKSLRPKSKGNKSGKNDNKDLIDPQGIMLEKLPFYHPV